MSEVKTVFKLKRIPRTIVALHIMRRASIALAVYVLLLLVYLGYPKASQLVAMILFYVVLGQAFNIFMGMTGYVDFGYVTFLALGAYGTLLPAKYLGVEGWLMIPAGIALALIMGAIIALIEGGIALRLRGAYFAIATIGLNEGIRYFIEGANIWGGSLGIIAVKEFRSAFGREGARFLMTTAADIMLWTAGLLAVIVTSTFLLSRIGFALQAIREDEDAAHALGINTTKYKVIAFTMSAVFGSLIGSTYWALKGAYVEPDHVFNIHYTVEAIVVVMLGGSGTLLGPIIGGTLYALLNYYFNVLLPGFQLLLLAPILIGVVVAMPEGIVGYIRSKAKKTIIREIFS